MATWYSGFLPGVGPYNGPVIVYNPIVVDRAGPVLAAFFYAHEYCHVQLDHIRQEMFGTNMFNRSWVSQRLELQADTCATRDLMRRGNRNAVRAAADYFFGQGPYQTVPTHPPGQVRANNIVATAQRSGLR